MIYHNSCVIMLRSMEKDNIQRELFDEFQQKKARSRRFGQFFQKGDFSISLNAEKMVFASIGFIMVLVVSFALGVERGRAVSAVGATAGTVPAQKPAQQARPAPAAQAQQPAQPKTAVPAAKAPAVTTAESGKPYTIVAAAFTKGPVAVAEVNRMKAAGITEAYMFRKDPYYMVYVGAFPDKESAQKTLNKVRQLRRDAYVRLK